MPKDEWGVKRVCPSCETRFYDLQRDPMTCPNCDATFDLESLLSKKGTTRVEKKDAEPKEEVTAEAEDAVVLDDDDDGESADVDIDDDLLDDDDDDDVSLDDIADVATDDSDDD